LSGLSEKILKFFAQSAKLADKTSQN